MLNINLMFLYVFRYVFVNMFSAQNNTFVLYYDKVRTKKFRKSHLIP